jgi:taurine dioxygenase
MSKGVRTRTVPLERRALSPYVGVEILGVDLSKALDEPTTSAIYEAWIEAGVLLFRGVEQNDDAQMRLSSIFGEMEPAANVDLVKDPNNEFNDPNNEFMLTHAYDPNDSTGRPSIFCNVDGIDLAGWLGWHWDQSFMPTIIRGIGLRMTHPARMRGETGFADAINAYDRLSEEMKTRIEKLEVVYKFNPDFASGQFGFPKNIRNIGASVEQRPYPDFPPTVHPLVTTQVETGRKVLKLSPMHSRYILGMDRAESDALLTELAEHIAHPDFAYFHRWQKNDIIVWDNWRMVHSSTGVPLDCLRSARRTTIGGDYKLGRYLDPTLDSRRKVKRIVD